MLRFPYMWIFVRTSGGIRGINNAEILSTIWDNIHISLYTFSHLKRPTVGKTLKNKKKCKINSRNFTNSIENYFSMLKSRLYKVSEEGEGLTHEKLKVNITNVIRGILKEKYENIIISNGNRSII